ncbi:MAG: Uncharacterized protein G01um101418_318 [Parcubacteria group bacterium Gr01-1014_18]|nr:MAG: Uncharacterized protein Greene041636_306 [Parcubacteria group bacterium Greene0416_36]TSC81178.1 MAG: Uncharacterized protein G01um101418_318 [Parcubacteria group bacterium Gr01-1014_18]TSC99175.1 MAG: Uncharacterized protein Greene101420_320 [Parcubacteria group bacterium Greene1014_20]TSD07467.1 MAG: Uncharacterized protein Greene07142_166 [Parcubacteria group bacterium Greene0714_2]
MRKILIALLLSILLVPSFVFAQDTTKDKVRGGKLLDAALSNTSVNTSGIKVTTEGLQTRGVVNLILVSTIIRYVKILLSLVGVILLILIIYSGILWLTAGGNSDQVEKAKTIITNCTIGAIIVGASYVIAGFIESLTRIAS